MQDKWRAELERMGECNKIEALSLELSWMDKQTSQSQNHCKIPSKSEEIVNVIVSTLKKQPRCLSNVSRTLKGVALNFEIHSESSTEDGHYL